MEADVEPYEVISNGVTVWVNREWCLARFGPYGIDIHRTPSEQRATGTECLFCTQGPTSFDDWKLFQQKVQELYGIEVEDKHCPERFS